MSLLVISCMTRSFLLSAINPITPAICFTHKKGELIGINTTIFFYIGSSRDVGFAIPANMAQPVFESLVKNGKVVRGFWGLAFRK